MVPTNATSVSFRAPERYKTVSLQILTPQLEEPYTAVMAPGEASAPFYLDGSQPASGSTFATYLWLGFTHILPKGLDHILFVLGLFLLSPGWRPLLLQVTAFTAAHSVTLALSMLGLVALPERIVETLIALSISWVAIENMATAKLKPWRLALVLAFGLLHGLGFAGVLRELGTPDQHFLTSLAAFNIGVELGQLTVIAIAFGVTVRFRHLAGYRRYLVLPCCALIALTGIWWAVSRALG